MLSPSLCAGTSVLTNVCSGAPSCNRYPDDPRGPWCYVSNRCLQAGPANTTGAAGLFWAGCDGVTDCQMTPFSPWGPCVIAGCLTQNQTVNGTQLRSRAIIAPEQNGGAPCGATTETRTCQAVCTDPAAAPTTAPTLAPAPPTPAPAPAPTAAPTALELGNVSLNRPAGTGGRRNRRQQQVFHGDDAALALEVTEACAAALPSAGSPRLAVTLGATTITVQTSRANAQTLRAAAAACQLCLSSGLCLTPTGSGLSCAAIAPSCANVRCGNGGVCVLARANCSDPAAPRTVPTCVCNSPVVPPECHFGARCESSFQCAPAAAARPHCVPALGVAGVGAPCRATGVPAGATFAAVPDVQACLAAPVATTSQPPVVTIPFNAGASGADGGSDSTAMVSGILVAALLLVLCALVLLMAWFKRRRAAEDGGPVERDAYDNPMYVLFLSLSPLSPPWHHPFFNG